MEENKINIKPLTNMWVCVSELKCIDYETFSCTRTSSIKKLVLNTSWTWRKWRRKGYRCIRVNVKIEEI